MRLSGSEDDRPSKRRRRDSPSALPRRYPRNDDSYSRNRGRSDLASKRRDYNDQYNPQTMRQSSHKPARSSRSPDRRQRDSTRRTSSDRDKAQRRTDRKRDYSRSRSRSRSTSRTREREHRKHRERTRDSKDRHRKKRSSRSSSPQPYRRSNAPLTSQNEAFTSNDSNTALVPAPDKQKPNFKTTGMLAALSNTIHTANQVIVLKYHEPAEARKPLTAQAWRLYIFKDDAILDTVELATQSCWLFGRETAVVDVPTEHPSCSKQHAVIQFRYTERRNEFGDRIGGVKPYLLDLESANGTHINGDRVPQAKYLELKDKDVVKFGDSTREYVVQLPPPGTVTS